MHRLSWAVSSWAVSLVLLFAASSHAQTSELDTARFIKCDGCSSSQRYNLAKGIRMGGSNLVVVWDESNVQATSTFRVTVVPRGIAVQGVATPPDVIPGIELYKEFKRRLLNARPLPMAGTSGTENGLRRERAPGEATLLEIPANIAGSVNDVLNDDLKSMQVAIYIRLQLLPSWMSRTSAAILMKLLDYNTRNVVVVFSDLSTVTFELTNPLGSIPFEPLRESARRADGSRPGGNGGGGGGGGGIGGGGGSGRTFVERCVQTQITSGGTSWRGTVCYLAALP